MANLNARTCITSLGNTGIQLCYQDPKFIAGGWLTPKGDEIDITNVQTALAGKLYNSNKAARWYPFYFLETPKFNNEAKTVQTQATGQKHVVKEGFNDWGFEYTQGGLTLHKIYRLFNGTNFDFVFFDNNSPYSNIMGIPGSSATKLKAIPSDGGFFWADPWTPNDGSKVALFMLQFVYNSKYLNDLAATVEAPFDIPSTLPGLIDVNLTSPGAGGSSGHYRVQVLSPLSIDIGSKYSANTQLAVATSWAPVNTATGAAITVTSVTWVPGSPGYFDLLLDTTDPDYPATGTVTINLAGATTLQAAGMAIESTGGIAIARN